MPQEAEAYDLLLAPFMEEVLAHAEATDTVVVIGSDHGLQGGLATLDYAVQMENRLPWMEMVVPQTVFDDSDSGLSLETFVANSDRLVTAFDLHKTLSGIIAPESRDQYAAGNHSAWASDLLRSQVPETRTCDQAKIPRDFCSCANEEATPLAPGFGVCNFAGTTQRSFCVADAT